MGKFRISTNVLFIFASAMLSMPVHADVNANEIMIRNRGLGLSTQKRVLNLQDALGRLHRPVEQYFKRPKDGGSYTWQGTARAICVGDNGFAPTEHSTIVTFTPSDDNNGTVVAAPSFAGMGGGVDFCTSTPTGERTAKYLVEGDKIYIETSPGSFSEYDVSVIDSLMSVTDSSSSRRWELKR